jgi:hypothetical protein
MTSLEMRGKSILGIQIKVQLYRSIRDNEEMLLERASKKILLSNEKL